jgi:putative phosphoesterase
MRIAVLSDIHANLPFAEAAVRRARKYGCDRILHLGDAIDLGPWPAETLDYLIDEGVEMIRGNHDEYPVMGLTPRVDAELSPEVKEHMRWTAGQLRAEQHALLAALPTTIASRIDNWTVRFQHFLLDENRVSERMIDHDSDSLLTAFQVERGQILCFGHIHIRIWHFLRDRAVLNPGATGFAGPDGAWFAVLVVREASAWIEWHPVDAEQALVVNELETRCVPGWESSVTYMFERAG